MSADVYITQGNNHIVDVIADADILDKIKIEVRDNKLHIGHQPGVNNLRGKVEIKITVKDLNEIAVAGSGKVITGSTFKADDISLKVSGSGLIVFDNLQAETVISKISGSGDIELAGAGSQELTAEISGSGKMTGENFPVENVMCKISGSGKCTVNASGDLEAKISGSGSVFYKGSPEVNSKVSGSGKVAKL
jgi:hypothetical protein